MKAAVQHQVYSKAMQWQTLQKHHGLHWTHDGHSISGLNPARKQCRAMLTLAPDGLRAGCTVYSYSIQCVQRSWKRFLLCRSITSRATGVNRCPVGNTSSRFQDSVQPTNVRVCSFQHVYEGRILICVSSQCEVRSISSQLHHQNQNDINILNPQQHGASYTNSMVGFGFELDRNVLMWSHQTTEAWAPTAIRLDSKPQQPSKRVCMHGPCIGLTRSGEAMGTGPIKIDMENENTWVSHKIWHLFQWNFTQNRTCLCEMALATFSTVPNELPHQHFLDSGSGSSEGCTHAVELNRPEQPAGPSKFYSEKNEIL